MEVLDNLKEAVIGLVLVALLIAAFALSLDGFQDGIEGDNPCVTSGNTFNTTDSQCYNSSGDLQANDFNYQYNISQEGLEGTANASGYLSTIGTLIGVAALVGIVILAFYIVRR